jgi:hypothetical protein
MNKLKEALDTNDKQIEHAKPTSHKTELNRHEVFCRECGARYWADDYLYRKVCSALEWDPSNNPFCCEDCEEAYAQEARTHS